MKKLMALAMILGIGGTAAAGSLEKTIAVPRRDQSVKIGFSSEGAKIESLRIQNYPNEEDVQKARREKPGDKSLTFWNFSVSNDSSRKVRMKIDVTVLGKDGEVVAHNDKSDTVDAGKSDDNIRVWVRIKTLDIVSAKTAKLRLSIEPK
jgi:hypothetical protein